MKQLTSKLAVLGRGGLLTIMGALSAWVVNIIHYSRYSIFAADFRGILAGEPYSPAFANRRLGPWSFVALARIPSERPMTLGAMCTGHPADPRCSFGWGPRTPSPKASSR